MSPADFILAFLSIVLALALQEVLQGFGRVVRSGRLRAAPVAHYLFALGLVVQMVQFWWAVWFWREIPTWTIVEFTLMLLGLTLLYLIAFLVFPSEGAENSGGYYMRSARLLWSLLAAQLLVVTIAVRTVLDLPYDLLGLLPPLVLAMLAAVALSSKREAVHNVVCAVVLLINIAALVLAPALEG